MRKDRVLKLPRSHEFAVSRDESLIVALGRDVALASLGNMSRVGSWRVFAHPSHACFSDDSKALAVKNTSGQVVVLRVPDGEVMSPPPPEMYDEGSAIYFSSCGEFLVDGSWSGFIRVRDSSDLRLSAEFQFENEMVSAACRSKCGSIWMFAHEPKTEPGKSFPGAPYCSLWNWPLESPSATVPCGTDTLDGAALSPDGRLIAVAGYRRFTEKHVLSIIDADGNVVVETELTGWIRGRMRWSQCGRFLSGAHENGFFVRSSRDLRETIHIPAEYPYDIVLLDAGKVALGAGKSGVVKVLPEWADAQQGAAADN